MADTLFDVAEYLGTLHGRTVWMPYRVWRELRVEAACEDPGPAPDGYDDDSLMIVSADGARLEGDDSE